MTHTNPKNQIKIFISSKIISFWSFFFLIITLPISSNFFRSWESIIINFYFLSFINKLITRYKENFSFPFVSIFHQVLSNIRILFRPLFFIFKESHLLRTGINYKILWRFATSDQCIFDRIFHFKKLLWKTFSDDLFILSSH